jgi:hypothetical protein
LAKKGKEEGFVGWFFRTRTTEEFWSKVAAKEEMGA